MEPTITSEQIRQLKMSAVMHGGITQIIVDGQVKKITGMGGYWYLDGVKVDDIDNEVLQYVEVDESYAVK